MTRSVDRSWSEKACMIARRKIKTAKRNVGLENWRLLMVVLGKSEGVNESENYNGFMNRRGSFF